MTRPINVSMQARGISNASRDGSVPLLMSLVMVLLVSSAAIALLRLEVARVRVNRQVASTKMLRTAIAEVRRQGVDDGASVRLPIRDSANRWIEIRAGSPGQRDNPGTNVVWTATEFRGGQAIFTVRDEVREETNE